MAIERMKSVWLFASHGEARETLDRLAAMGLSHLSDCGLAGTEDWEALGIERIYPEVGDVERRVQLLRETLDALAAFSKSSREFLENFIPTPIEVRESEVRRSLSETDIEAMHKEASEANRRHAALAAELQKAEKRLKPLEVIAGLKLTLPGVRALRRTAALVGLMPTPQFARLQASRRLPEASVVSAAERLGRQALVQTACSADERDATLAVLREFQFELIEPEEQTVALDEYVCLRRNEVKRLREEVERAEDNLKRMAEQKRGDVEMVLGYWEERLNITNAASLLAESKRVTILKGYVRDRDLADFQGRVAAELPNAAILVRDPQPDEPVPVSLRNSNFFAPAQFLVTMFGMPNYFTFDPTRFIFFNFLLFFGFCFGDAIYGSILFALGLLLARKYRSYSNIRHFFTLLAYAGVSAFIVGVLTGAWAADLLSAAYLSENNLLVRMRETLMVVDMVEKSLLTLCVALMLGVANQLFSVVCLMLKNFKRGNPWAAIFDGGFWLLFLPGLVLLVCKLFVALPSWLLTTALVMMAIGALGLVLTQGRAQETLIGKAIVGILSLYGIVGTYGATTFIGDTLSYSRLLALGLTTTIVGISFNLIAGLTKGIPYVGFVMFVFLLIFGHVLNFFISILGAFVHSVRLMFVEFFSKFYEGDAPTFAPLGTWRGRIRVTDAATVWAD